MKRRDENFLYDGGGVDDYLFDYNGIELDHTSFLWVWDGRGWKRIFRLIWFRSLSLSFKWFVHLIKMEIIHKCRKGVHRVVFTLIKCRQGVHRIVLIPARHGSQ